MNNKNIKSPKVNGNTAKRLIGYIFKDYKKRFILVCLFIILSAISGVCGTLFIQILVDDYIAPLTQVENPVYTGLLKAILIMGTIYLIGILANLFYSRIMVSISQGVLKKIRDEMFRKMQKLPIKYFDTHTHGDIMSHYTNDTDTLEQMISQSIPQLFSSLITIVAVIIAMIASNIYLALTVIISVLLILLISKKVTAESGKYFVEQQRALGKVNGYIEEMINGQKVVKVFCHEQEAKEDFDKINEVLCDDATKANTFANILMPLLGNLSYLQYITVAIIGGTLAINEIGTITTGMVIAFLELSRSFSRPINQISQQFNLIVMALAGAERIFELMDEEPEYDNGYVTLVNAKIENNKIIETNEHTGKWAWKHPHQDGTITYEN